MNCSRSEGGTNILQKAVETSQVATYNVSSASTSTPPRDPAVGKEMDSGETKLQLITLVSKMILCFPSFFFTKKIPNDASALVAGTKSTSPRACISCKNARTPMVIVKARGRSTAD